MPLITLPDGSHRYAPDPLSVLQDVDQLVQPRELGRVDQLNRGGGYTEQAMGGGLFVFRAHLGEGRGVFRQRGYLEDHLADFSDGHQIYDDFEKAHNGFLTEFQQSVLPVNGLPEMLAGAYFAGSDVFMCPDWAGSGQNRLYKSTSTDIPAVSLVTGFTRPAGAGYAYCMKRIQIAGQSALAIGWDTGATSSLQILTDLANPPTVLANTFNPGFTTWGICQTPIDNESIQLYTADGTGGLIKRFNTNVAPASATVEDSRRMPFNGYTVGLVNLDGNPDVFYCVPIDNPGQLGGSAGSGGSTAYSRSPTRYKLLRTDLRAQYGPQEVTIQTPHIKYATPGANCIFYCDGTTHRYMTNGADLPVDTASDRPVYSPGNFVRECRGHHRVDDRFFWTENEVDQLGGVSYWRRFEYDTKTRRSWPVTARTAYAHAGVQAMGGPNLPVSALSGHLVDMHVDAWTFQYQPPTGVLGSGLGHVDGGGALSGKRYNQAGIRYSPVLRSKNHPLGRIVVSQLIAPPLADIRRGTGTEPDLVPSEAYSRITFSDQTTFTVYANELGDHRTALAFPDNDSWVSEFFWALTTARGTTGANAARYSGNGSVWTIGGYIYDPPMVEPSRNYRGWGAEEAAPSNMRDLLA